MLNFERIIKKSLLLLCIFMSLESVGSYAEYQHHNQLDHDVGCLAVLSPPEGPAEPGHYDIIGYICNLGANTETFDVRATVYDTNGWVPMFDGTLTLTDFPAGGDTNLSFGTLWFGSDTVYYTEIYTLLINDMDPSNDTSTVYTRPWGIGWQYELDIQAATGDNQCTGIEFDGTYFYMTGGNNAMDPNKIYVVDTAGNLIWTLDQPAHATGWGWRNIWWDYTFSGPSGIGYLYSIYAGYIEQFSIDLQGGALIYHGFFPCPPFLPYLTSAVYMPDSDWYFSPIADSIYKWTWVQILQTGPQPGYYIFDGAYDTDSIEGGWVWWHSQDDPGTGFLCQISQMDAITMEFIGSPSGYSLPMAITDGVAGGICFYEGFRNHDMLFALVQGTPHDYIVGIPIREHVGIEEQPPKLISDCFGFVRHPPNPMTSMVDISFLITQPCKTSLRIYDTMGRLVRTLVDGYEQAGKRTVYWDGKDNFQRQVASGVYLLHLNAGDQTDIHKVVVLKSENH